MVCGGWQIVLVVVHHVGVKKENPDEFLSGASRLSVAP